MTVLFCDAGLTQHVLDDLAKHAVWQRVPFSDHIVSITESTLTLLFRVQRGVDCFGVCENMFVGMWISLCSRQQKKF